jgi:RIO-like serine/threonine protein kinase
MLVDTLFVSTPRWAIGPLLGVGRRSRVYTALDHATGKQAAVKVCHS